jgi:hypothetical protein
MAMTSRNGHGARSRRQGTSQDDESRHRVRVEQRNDGSPGPAIRVLLTNGEPGRHDVDLTRSFTSAIAHALWMARAGDDEQNWIEAERLLERLLGDKAQRPERRPVTTEPREEPIGPLPEPGRLNGARRTGTLVART